MPVFGSTGTGFQDPSRRRTNFCGQQPERDLGHYGEVEETRKTLGTITLRTQSTTEGMIKEPLVFELLYIEDKQL